jgi:hypothetical protein
MFLDTVLAYHAWSNARTKHETERVIEHLEGEANEIEEMEEKQGRFSRSSFLAWSPSFFRPFCRTSLFAL